MLETSGRWRYLRRMSDVTQILSQIEHGDTAAADQLLPLVYEELRKLAAAKLAQEKPGQTLQATALVHEAYLRLVDVRASRPTGIPVGISFPQPPSRCGGFLSSGPVARDAIKRGGDRLRSTSMTSTPSSTRPPISCSRSMRHRRARA